jgi:RNA-splicing ligase RtcB
MSQVWKGPLEQIDEYRWRIPKNYKPGMRVDGLIFASKAMIEQITQDQAPEQVANVAFLPGIVGCSIAMPDIHWGYGFPVGGVAAMDVEEGVISPGGIGYDINCLRPDTRVLTAHGYWRRIGEAAEAWLGQAVVCFRLQDGVQESGAVGAVMQVRPRNRVYRLRTASGYEVVATSEHPFWTPEGMRRLEQLPTGARVAVYPFEGVPYEPASDAVLVDEARLREHLRAQGKSATATRQIAAQLRQRSLLPLRADAPQVPYLLKLMGYLTGDGTMRYVGGSGKGVAVFYGKPDDLERIRADITRLGFTPSPVRMRCRQHTIQTPYRADTFEARESSFSVSSSAFVALLACLGAPLGNKATQPYRVPEWLMRAPLWQQRLYLAALFGAELSAPSTLPRCPATFQTPVLSVSKREPLTGSGWAFLADIQAMLARFGVRARLLNRQHETTTSPRTGARTVRCRLQILGDDANLIRLWSQIGYEYHAERQRRACLAVAYLRCKHATMRQFSPPPQPPTRVHYLSSLHATQARHSRPHPQPLSCCIGGGYRGKRWFALHSFPLAHLREREVRATQRACPPTLTLGKIAPALLYRTVAPLSSSQPSLHAWRASGFLNHLWWRLGVGKDSSRWSLIVHPRIPKDFPSFAEFAAQADAGGGRVWDTVVAIEPVDYTEPFVYDLTVQHPDHNFVANGFVVSNCGVRLLRTDLTEQKVRPRLKELLDQIFRDVPAGFGGEGLIKTSRADLRQVMLKGAHWMVEHGYGWDDDLAHTEATGRLDMPDPDVITEKAIERGKDQLGTLGGGNHFLEIQVVDEIYDPVAAEAMGITQVGQVTIMIHTGSRGFGHQTCQDHLDIMEEAHAKYGISLPDRQLACAPIKSEEGQTYLRAMHCAANFAFANRQAIAHWTRQAFAKIFNATPESLGMRQVYDVAHNIAKIEEHEWEGKKVRVCVHRKGATRAFPPGHPETPEAYRAVGQPVLIPGDMGRYSFVLVGTEGAMRESFGTTCHGAGRMMSRKGALREAKNRNIAKEMEAQGILVRAQNKATLAEEASYAYKDVANVVEVVHNAGIARKVARLRPIGVVKG